MKQKGNVSMLLIALIIMGSVSAYAGTSWSSFSTTVPRFNGSGYTSYQTKSISSEDAEVDIDYVGGDYEVDIRLVSQNRNSKWERNVVDGMFFYIPNSVQAGERCRLEISNDLSTPVKVQVEGEWRSN
ncbi:hypothetical protein CIW83_05345 [Tissierella sp. P1]|uniref:Uncharacterized protein n=1 Tax=Tissierella carlieri TaxID=689904 RepID=A0ABT1SFB8_9FIRM|nr:MULTISPECIES: hypothetical protein [Tissierella]MCQ4925156.1 hypothetical protein [Tissierella carlieri]OZV13299.1 hypothetical protein CIW83_05345 [Tissierella sp. P1]